MPGTK